MCNRGDTFHEERQAHAPGWKGTGRYQVSGYHGKMTGQEKTSYEGHDVSSWESGHGHTGVVEAEERVQGGLDVTSYAAGPYRTQKRAQVAASALSNRVISGPASRSEAFRGGTTHWTHSELAYDG